MPQDLKEMLEHLMLKKRFECHDIYNTIVYKRKVMSQVYIVIALNSDDNYIYDMFVENCGRVLYLEDLQLIVGIMTNIKTNLRRWWYEGGTNGSTDEPVQ